MPELSFSLLADIAGCFGFVLSALLAICGWWKTRMHLSVDIDFECLSACSFYSSKYLNAVIAFSFVNKSSNPISVNYVSIECSKNASYRCSLEKGYVSHHFRPLIDTDMKYYEFIKESADFPLNMNSYGACYEYISFAFPRDFQIETVKHIRIVTNHGATVIDDLETIQRFQQFLSEAHPGLV